MISSGWLFLFVACYDCLLTLLLVLFVALMLVSLLVVDLWFAACFCGLMYLLVVIVVVVYLCLFMYLLGYSVSGWFLFYVFAHSLFLLQAFAFASG